MSAAIKRVFISYSRRQGNWVWNRLKPCLEGGGATVLIDRERFDVGYALVGQMDNVQDTADVNVLVLSRDYLKSKFCQHEMDRAILRDPSFRNGVVIPVCLDDCKLPQKIKRPNPVHVDLRHKMDEEQWELLMRGCGADLGVPPPNWLRAKDEIVRWLQRKESVNLLTGSGVKWRPLLNHIRETAIPHLRIVDLESPGTASRRGLLVQILREYGQKPALPDKPDDLVEFGRMLESLPSSRLALVHFDNVLQRHGEYGVDLFAALRFLALTQKKLVLLIQSRSPLASLLPANHPLSEMDVKTSELKGRR